MDFVWSGVLSKPDGYECRNRISPPTEGVQMRSHVSGGRRRHRTLVSLAGAVVTAIVMAAAINAAPGAKTAAPVNEDEPVVSGAAVVGSTLTGTTGNWTGGVSTYAYQWVRCDSDGGLPDGSNCAERRRRDQPGLHARRSRCRKAHAHPRHGHQRRRFHDRRVERDGYRQGAVHRSRSRQSRQRRR